MKKTNLMLGLLLFIMGSTIVKAQTYYELQCLKIAYPYYIRHVDNNYIEWRDGSRMLVKSSSPLIDFFAQLFYQTDPSLGSITLRGLQNDHYEPFFRKMYGGSREEVKAKLITIYWMPNVFGHRYPLKVTTINDIDKRLQRISAELEKLPPSYYKYLENPAGGFYWRKVLHQSYLSAHSFGMAVDINSHYSDYWQWDLQKSKLPMSQLVYHNRVPKKIVAIFEKENFFWGGRWHYYDTMHFEYRPELFVNRAG